MPVSREQKLEKRRLRERSDEFRERWREYKAMKMREYYAKNSDAAARNKQRARERYWDLKAHAWLAQIFQEPPGPGDLV